MTKKSQGYQTMRWAVASYFFVSGFTYASWASRIPTIQMHLGLNKADLGSALFTMPLGMMITLPFTGMLLKRYNSRLIMLLGSIIFNICLFMLGWTDFRIEFISILFLFGSSRNLMNISINAQAVGIQAHFKGSIMAGFHAIWSAAGFIGATIGALMISANISPRWHFLLIAVSSTLLMVITYPKTLKNDAPYRNNNSTAKKDKKKDRNKFLLSDPTILRLGIIAFCSLVAEGTMYDWSSIYFRDEVKAEKSMISVGYIAFMGSMTVGRFLGDFFVNRFGSKLVLLVSGALISFGLLTSVILPYSITATIGFLLTGLGVSCIVPLIIGMAGKHAPNNAGSVIAAVSTISYTGFLLGPPFIGYIAQIANLRWAFCIIALSGLLIIFLLQQQQQHIEALQQDD